MDLQTIINLVRQTPQVQQAVDAMERQLARAPIMPEDIDEIIGMLEAVVKDPNRYPEVRAAAIKDGIISEQEAPMEYNPEFVLAVLVALYEYRDRLSAQGYARGGLKVAGRKLQAAGRGGDSMLAHINPREAEMLQRMGGSGTVNPNTGLREYKSGKSILGAVLPIALNFIVPGIGGMIGTALGASGAAATMLGGAVLGGLSSAISGGNPLQGALLGGLGGGFGEAVGSTLAPTLSAGTQGLIGNALVGGAAGALTGQGFGRGALMGVAGNLLGQATQGVGEGAFGAGIGAAGKSAGQMLTAGFNPRTALLGGALSGLATGVTQAGYNPFDKKPPEQFTGQGLKPSTAVVDGLKAPPGQSAEMMRYGTTNYLTGEQGLIPGRAPTLVGDATAAQEFGTFKAPADALKVNLPNIQGTAPTTTASSSPLSLKNLGTLALVSQLAASRPPEVNQEISRMSPAQQEYFNRPSVKWDWNKLQGDANAANMSLSQYMASYWPQVTSGMYNMAAGGLYAMGGGPLGAVARLARGAGSGRDDTINARLSDGEYVMDAETVAMLGDGSTDAGARRLDDMRSQLRKHKGKTLAKGKFSPNAKSPLAYLKGAA